MSDIQFVKQLKPEENQEARIMLSWILPTKLVDAKDVCPGDAPIFQPDGSNSILRIHQSVPENYPQQKNPIDVLFNYDLLILI